LEDDTGSSLNKSRRFASKQPQDFNSTSWSSSENQQQLVLSRPQSASGTQSRPQSASGTKQVHGEPNKPRPIAGTSSRGGYDSGISSFPNEVRNRQEHVQLQNQPRVQGQRLVTPLDARPSTTSSMYQKQQQQPDRPSSAGSYQESDYFNKNVPRSLKPSSAGSPYKNHVQSSVIRTPSNTGIISSQTLHRSSTAVTLVIYLMILTPNHHAIMYRDTISSRLTDYHVILLPVNPCHSQ